LSNITVPKIHFVAAFSLLGLAFYIFRAPLYRRSS